MKRTTKPGPVPGKVYPKKIAFDFSKYREAWNSLKVDDSITIRAFALFVEESDTTAARARADGFLRRLHYRGIANREKVARPRTTGTGKRRVKVWSYIKIKDWELAPIGRVPKGLDAPPADTTVEQIPDTTVEQIPDRSKLTKLYDSTTPKEKPSTEFTAHQLGTSFLALIRNLQRDLLVQEQQTKQVRLELAEKVAEAARLANHVKDLKLKINELNDKLAKGEKTFKLEELHQFRTALPPGTG